VDRGWTRRVSTSLSLEGSETGSGGSAVVAVVELEEGKADREAGLGYLAIIYTASGGETARSHVRG
jgi:hypothetical protein